MSDSKISELEAVVDDLMGAPALTPEHSPENDDAAVSPQTETGAPGNGVAIPDSVPSEKNGEKNDGTPEKKDSVPEEKTPVSADDYSALQQELANTKKRLHDTQKAMHEANTQKAELQKKLDSINQKKDDDGQDDDNWFKDDDGNNAIGKIKEELAEVKQQSSELKNQQQEYQQELMRQQWFKEAEEFARNNSDFEEIVYQKLEPLLDEETGDPMILALYKKEADKSPAGAYAFAKKLFGYQDKLNAPETKNAGIPENTNTARKTSANLNGKAGLDRLNSAEFPEERRPRKNMVDEIFG